MPVCLRVCLPIWLSGYLSICQQKSLLVDSIERIARELLLKLRFRVARTRRYVSDSGSVRACVRVCVRVREREKERERERA